MRPTHQNQFLVVRLITSTSNSESDWVDHNPAPNVLPNVNVNREKTKGDQANKNREKHTRTEKRRRRRRANQRPYPYSGSACSAVGADAAGCEELSCQIRDGLTSPHTLPPCIAAARCRQNGDGGRTSCKEAVERRICAWDDVDALNSFPHASRTHGSDDRPYHHAARLPRFPKPPFVSLSLQPHPISNHGARIRHGPPAPRPPPRHGAAPPLRLPLALRPRLLGPLRRPQRGLPRHLPPRLRASSSSDSNVW